MMTPECAVVKLMLCLAYPNLPITLPLAGEVRPRVANDAERDVTFACEQNILRARTCASLTGDASRPRRLVFRAIQVRHASPSAARISFSASVTASASAAGAPL